MLAVKGKPGKRMKEGKTMLLMVIVASGLLGAWLSYTMIQAEKNV